MFNQAIVMGYLGQDPELRYTQNQTAVVALSVATTKKWTDSSGEKKEHTEWHRIVVWGAQAENCSKYLKKGSPVHIVGELNTRSYDDKDGVKRYVTEIRANSVNFLPSGSGGGARPPHPADDGESRPKPAAAASTPSHEMDEIPF